MKRYKINDRCKTIARINVRSGQIEVSPAFEKLSAAMQEFLLLQVELLKEGHDRLEADRRAFDDMRKLHPDSDVGDFLLELRAIYRHEQKEYEGSLRLKNLKSNES